jgi:hypothetical protein
VNNNGVADVSGGAGGQSAGPVTEAIRAGGGGGGASGGDGGGGRAAPAGTVNDALPGFAGDPGHVLETIVDPTALN